MDRVSRVRPRQLPLRSPSARIGFPRSEEWFKPPGAIRRQGWSVDWDKCGAGPGCFHLIAGEVRGLARGDAAASGASESPWDDKPLALLLLEESMSTDTAASLPSLIGLHRASFNRRPTPGVSR